MTHSQKGLRRSTVYKDNPDRYTLFNQALVGSFADMQVFRNNIAVVYKEKDSKELVPSPPLKQMAFKGGGAKGAAYPGVVSALDEEGYLEEIDTVFGASAGAITAFMVGLGFSADQFKRLANNIKFTDFTDIKEDGWGAYFKGHGVGNLLDLIQHGGVYSGESFHDLATYLVEQILGSPNATFADLHNARMLDPSLKEMVFKATRYNAKPGEMLEQTFSYLDTPNIRIADALRASMAFPGAFLPKTVRDKNGKVFGVFADGGILNNYPIDEANRQEYYDTRYRPIEKLDHHGKPHQVNPCAVGLNLISNPAHLDDKITPLTPKLQRMREQKLQASTSNPRQQHKDNTQEMAQELQESDVQWGHHDIIKGVFWNKVGRLVREDTKEKQALYADQTVQIWCEGVGTLEFDAPKKKLDNIFNSGKNAMKKWLVRNKNPSRPYAYHELFDDRLTKADKLLRQNNPEAFYLQKLTDLYVELFNEINKIEKQKNHSDMKLLRNVKIQYLCQKIEENMDKVKKISNINPHAFEEKAYQQAKKSVNDKIEQLKKQRERRELLINDDLLIGEIAEKLIKNPSVGVRMLKGQLSRVIPLIRTPQGSNLISLAVQTQDTVVAQQVFELLNRALRQCYYQGREADIKYDLPQMLNELAKPPLFSVLAGRSNVRMVNLVMQYGADPLALDPITHTNGLQEMIIANDFESFKAIIQFCQSKKTDVMNIRLGSQSIGHFILNSANDEFIQKLLADPSLAKSVLNYHTVDGHYNDIVHLGALLAKDKNAVKWKLVKEFSRSRVVPFEKAKKHAQENYNAHQERLALTEDAFQQILNAVNPQEKIANLKPQDCFRIFNAYVRGKGILRICELAQDPGMADIFIAMCERIEKNSSTFKQLQQLLNQKINGKTILYSAAKAGNLKLVKHLRKPKYDSKINGSGPINEPCALLIAAKYGHFEVVSALMKSIPYGLRIGYHSVSRRQQENQEQLTPLHYLAKFGTPEAFCDVLYGGGMRSLPSKVAMMKDSFGKTPITYLIEYNRMDILEEIIKRGKGARKGYVYNGDYHFATLFGWRADNAEYDDLELALRINPNMYQYLCDNLSGRKSKKDKILSKVEHHAKEYTEKLNSKMMLLSEEMTKRELSKIGQSEYDDWVIIDKENVENKNGSRQYVKDGLRTAVLHYSRSKSVEKGNPKDEGLPASKGKTYRSK